MSGMIQLLRRVTAAISFLVVIVLFTGCSKTPAWFMGSFEFDAEESFKPLLEAAGKDKTRAPEKDGLSGALEGLATALAPVALAANYNGAVISITKSEIVTTKDGSGTVVKFEVYQLPDKDTVVIKTSGDNIETWSRTENGIARKSTGDIKLVAAFKRKKL